MTVSLNLQSQRESGPLILNLAPPGPFRVAAIAGQNQVTGQIVLGIVTTCAIAGQTAPCSGHLTLAYDPNLLSDTTAHFGSAWQHGAVLTAGESG